MSFYLNMRFPDERLAVEIATNAGLAAFSAWAQSLPADFALVRQLAVEGEGKGSPELEDQLTAALKAHPPDGSAAEVARRLIEVVPHEGTVAISQEADDGEDEDAEDWM